MLFATVMIFAVGAELGHGQAATVTPVASSGVPESTTNTTSARGDSAHDANLGSSAHDANWGYSAEISNTRKLNANIGQAPKALTNSLESTSGQSGVTPPASGQSGVKPPMTPAINGQPNSSGTAAGGVQGNNTEGTDNPPGVTESTSDAGATVTGYNSSGGVSGPPPPPIARAFVYAASVKPTDYLFLCLSIISCVFAFFMLYQSTALQRMLTKGQENAPDPDSGTGISWLLFWLVFGVCGFYWIANAQRQIGSFDLLDFFRRDWWSVALESPRTIAYIFLIAGVAPGVIAIYKFTFVIVWLFFRRVRTRGISRIALGPLTKEDASSTLDRIEENVNALKSKFSAFESQSTAMGRITRTGVEQPERRNTADIGYLLMLGFWFCAIAAGLFWASKLFPNAKLFSLVACAFVLVVVFAALDLRKGGKLSDHSLEVVLGHAFEFFEHLCFTPFRRQKKPTATPEHSSGGKIDPPSSGSGTTKTEV